jgi:anaerobic magnesium-protoporphyrin IX monomethyl ester cyclase
VDGFDSFNKGQNWANHAIGILTSILRRDGHIVEYLDCRKLSGWDEVTQAINAKNFELVLISLATVDSDPAKRLAKIIKQKGNIPIIVGGPHPTLALEVTQAVKEFDYIVTHEAELTLPKLLEELRLQLPVSRVTKGEMPLDLDTIPFFDWSIQPDGEYPWFTGLQHPYYSIIASRGCFGKCRFCQPAERAVFGNKVRKRSVDNILSELESLARDRGMKSFLIQDDCFTQFPSWVAEFCEKKKNNPYLADTTFACQSRADIICRNPGLVQKLKDAGLMWVIIGFESGSDRVLKYIQKDVTVEQNLEAGKICHSLGIKIFANFIFGFPGESRGEMWQTTKMIRKIKPDIYSPTIFTPVPGSDLYQYCKENDLILFNKSEMYRRNPFSGKKIRGQHYWFANFCIFWCVDDKIARLTSYFLRRV